MMTFPPLAEIHTVLFDFDGVFTDNKVYVTQEEKELVCCDRRDGLAFQLLRKYQKIHEWPLDIFVISKETNPVLLSRTKKLKLETWHGVEDKLSHVRDEFAKRRPTDSNPFSGLIYVGNDLNDLAVMRRARCSIAPSDAHPMIQHIATHVFPEKGGDGFIRSFIEALLGMSAMSLTELEELVS